MRDPGPMACRKRVHMISAAVPAHPPTAADFSIEISAGTHTVEV